MNDAAPPPMPNELRLNLTQLSLVVGIVLGLTAVAGAWFVLPYRVGAAEAKIRTLEVKVETQNEILIRIDENVKALKASR